MFLGERKTVQAAKRTWKIRFDFQISEIVDTKCKCLHFSEKTENTENW